MSALPLLRDFSHAVSSDFESLPVPASRHAALCDDAYQRGLQSGQEQAKESGTDSLSVTVAALSETLGDAQALRESMTREFGAALAQIAQTLCPALASKGYAEAVKAAIETALTNTATTGVIRVHPAQVDIVTQILERLDASTVTLKADDTLSGLAMEMEWLGGGSGFDLEKTANDIIALSETFHSVPSTEREHP